VAVGTRPQGIAIGSDGTIFVASQNANRVSAIDPLTNQVDDSVTVGSGPYGIAVTRTGLVVAANNFESTASIVAAVSPALTTSSAFAGDSGSLTIGGLPAGVLVDDTTVRAISFGDDTVPWTRTPGTNTFNWLIPSGSGSEDVIVSLNGGNRAYAGTFTYSVAPPPPPTPSSAPRDVVAAATDGSASMSWSAPVSAGSFPVTNYLATSSPDGRTCLVAAPALTCDVMGLTNGTAYTFTVKALTGAGWSESSAPSNVVVPRPDAKPSIVITGARDGQRIQVSGSTIGFGMGAILNPWVRLAGQSAYSQGSAQVLVSMDGTFQWGRRAGKQVSVYMQTPDGSVRSNTVTVRAR
jgi:YVTN family beta-propeller protein